MFRDYVLCIILYPFMCTLHTYYRNHRNDKGYRRGHVGEEGAPFLRIAEWFKEMAAKKLR